MNQSHVTGERQTSHDLPKKKKNVRTQLVGQVTNKATISSITESNYRITNPFIIESNYKQGEFILQG